MENDDKLRQLFHDFNPPMSDDKSFMARLENRLETVEMIRRNNRLVSSHNRTALLSAMVAGILIGIILTVTFPLICSFIENIIPDNLSADVVALIAHNTAVIGWCTVGLIIMGSMIIVYNLAVAVLLLGQKHKASRQQSVVGFKHGS